MRDFAELLVAYGIHYSDNTNKEEQRIAVVLLDQAMEIMMNAFLIEKDYRVFCLQDNDIRNGLMESQNSHDDRTPSFPRLLEAVKRELPTMN